MVLANHADEVEDRQPEAVVEALFVVDREAGRLLVMERAARLPFAPCALQLGRPHDDAGQRHTGPQLIEPLWGKRHRIAELKDVGRNALARSGALHS